MDRRRFVPSPEGLEVRTLQTQHQHVVRNPGSARTSTFRSPTSRKSLRIQHLPFYLDQIHPRPVSAQGRDQADPELALQHAWTRSTGRLRTR